MIPTVYVLVVVSYYSPLGRMHREQQNLCVFQGEPSLEEVTRFLNGNYPYLDLFSYDEDQSQIYDENRIPHLWLNKVGMV